MSFAGASNIVITNGTFNNHHVRVHNSKGGFEHLQENVAHGAFHDSGERFDPPRCHSNTRVAIINKIMKWFQGLDQDYRDSLFLWLYGAAGAGKSAIAQTIAEMLDIQHVILASFFFSRNNPRRGTAQFLVPTLAYQLAAKLPLKFREVLVQALEDDPLLITRSLETQIKTLIRDPFLQLLESEFSCDHNIAIIIDGLDECEDPKVQARVLYSAFRVLGGYAMPLKILIASRPEVEIASAFNSKAPAITRVALDDDYHSREDIERFLVDKFCEIKTRHHLHGYIPDAWPPPHAIGTLVERSSGQFIYASTVARFVESPRHRPTHRLEIILGIRPTKPGDNPFAELDALYQYILTGVDEVNLIQKILGFVLLRPPGFYEEVSVSFVEAFLSLESGEVPLLLQNLGSLVCLDNWIGARGPQGQISRGPWIRILHASLKDYLFDRTRSKDLYLDPPIMHACFSELSLAHMNTGLEIHEIWTVFDRLFHHVPHAQSNPRLIIGVLDLSLTRCMSLYQHHKKSNFRSETHFIGKYIQFLDSLKSSWDDFQVSLFVEDEMAAFKQCIHSQIGANVPYTHLAFLLATISETEHNVNDSTDRGFLTFDLLSVGSHLRTRRSTTLLGWLMQNGRDWSRSLRQIFCDVVKERIASEQRKVDFPNIYASAAVFALRSILLYFALARKRPKSLHSRRSGTYIPRSLSPSSQICYTHYGARRFLERCTLSRIKKSADEPAIGSSRSPVSSEIIYGFVWATLNDFLARSGHSQELINLARHALSKNNVYRLGFRYRDPFWENRWTWVLVAIKEYLKRVD